MRQKMETTGAKLIRYKGNPILKPTEKQPQPIFNCAAIKYKDDIYLLPRVIKKGYTPKKGERRGYDNYISEIWLAKGDGKNFILENLPIIKPEYEYEKYGCEDSRVTKLGDDYLITYTALSVEAFSGKGDRIALASTKDFSKFKKYGIIGPDFNSKAGAFFPEKINGKIVFLFKDRKNSVIKITLFDGDVFNMANWQKHWDNHKSEENILISQRENTWEDYGVEVGAPPVKTDRGWLLIYSAISKDKKWTIGAVLLDLKDPRKVIARSKKPLLEAEMDYEKNGDIPDVVFPEGALVKEDQLFVYYGAADKRCCLATIELKDVVDELLR